MTNSVAMSTLNVQTMASLYHDLVEETELFREIIIADSRSGAENV